MNQSTLGKHISSEILIVDDTVSNLMFLSDMLSSEGYFVRSVNSGESALQSIEANIPSLVLLDVMMPGMDGFEVCRILKSNENTCDIPVIFISAMNDEDSTLAGFHVGGVDYISKPFRKEEVLARVKTQFSLFRLQLDLKIRNENLEREILRRKQAELAVEKRLIAMTQPLENMVDIDFSELFNIAELQKLQDRFANAFGVASVITKTDGTPITNLSNFTRLCQNIIRCTEKGLKNCMYSDSVIGSYNPAGPIVMPCLSGGLWDAGASITVGGKHVANWMIGQVRNEVQKESEMVDYALEIGADMEDFMSAFYEIPAMSQDQFRKISEVLFTMAGQLSDMAYQNAQQMRFIKGQKLAEQALLESEERFRTALLSIGDGVITTDAEGIVKLMNPVAEILTGWSQEEASGKPLEEVFSIIDELTRKQVEIPARKVLFDGLIAGLTNHTTLIAKDGSEHPISDSGAPIRNENGEIVGVILVFRDQTEEREAEKVLQKSETKFRNLFANASVGIYISDIDGKMQVNKAFCEMLGYSESEFEAITWQEITHPNDIQKSIVMMNSLLQNEAENIRFEKRFIHKNGNVIWTDVSSTLQFDTNNNPSNFITTVSDITKRKSVEDSLRKFKMGIENSADAIFITDLDGKIEYTNPAFEKIYGYRSSEVIGQTPRILKSGLLSSLDYQHFWNTLLDKKPIAGEIQNKAKDGQLITIEGTNNPILNENGDIIGFISINHDITERKKIEDSLRESEEKFRILAEYAPLAICIYQGEDWIYVNPATVTMSGFSMEELHQKKYWEFMAPEYQELIRKNGQLRMIGKGVEGSYEFRMVTKDGTSKWGYLTSSTIEYKGKTAGIFSVVDISGRKQMEEELRNAEMKMNAFFDQSLDGFSFMTFDDPIEWNSNADKGLLLEYTFSHLRITRLNDAMLDQYGATRDQIIGFTPNDFFAHDIEYGKNIYRQLFDKGKLHIETNERKLNGEHVIIEGDYTCQYDQKGRIVGYFGIQRDITQNKKAIETIQNERKLLRTLIDNLPYPIYVKDNECRKIVANLADYENICCSNEADVLGKTDLELFDSEVGPRGYADDLMVIQTGEAVINREEAFLDKNGIKRWLLTSKIPLTDQYGKIDGLVGIGRDITEQKKANEAILRLSQSIEQSPSIIVITDINGNIEYVNPKFTEITGYTDSEVIGKNPRIWKSGLMLAETYKQLWETITSGEVWRGELLNRNKNGELQWEWATIAGIKNENGIITNYIATEENISARKQMEVELILAKEKAEENDRLKSAFLANMSHEIRTPLNSIIGFSELLSDPDFESNQRYEFASIITASGNNLLAIISDIMDISKIEAGQVEIRKNTFPAQKLILDVCKEYRIRALDKGIDLKISPNTPDEDCFINSDQPKLKQVLINFVGNALKFTEKGTIEIGMDVSDSSIRFFVKDSGIGIPVEYHQHVFERFRQVEDSSTRKYGGNGLGLAISKSLIEMLGGTIGMESVPGEGSVFYFTVPRN